MVVRHNLSAMNSHRQLGTNTSSTAKNLEKLSSGFRINRAGDDAAGLAISEKMRGQIRGLDMATQNAENGISLIQTAEGALNETHAILQRIRELSVQASNGTYHNVVDRENLNKEVQALKYEIDRISSSTHYNGINLLDGTIEAKTAAEWNLKTLTGTGEEVSDIGVFLFPLGLSGNTTDTLTFHDTSILGENALLVVSKGESVTTATISLQTGGKTYALDPENNKDFIEIDASGNKSVVASLKTPFMNNLGYVPWGYGVVSIETKALSNVYDLHNPENLVTYKGWSNWANVIGLENLNPQITFQIGANGTADQRIGLEIQNMGTGNLGDLDGTATYLTGTRVVNVDVSTIDKANESITVLDAAINQVSGTRAGLGALQNRLEHTINNLGVARENLQSAESGIRDVDMAKEMMEFTKNNILAQASQSMLAQANQMPQGIMQLLAA